MSDRKRTEASGPTVGLKDVVLAREDYVRVRALAGFTSKFHKIPDAVNEGSRRLMAKIAQKDLEGFLDEAYAEVQKRMRYTRKELTLEKPDDGEGLGSISTPDFFYTIAVVHQEDDPSRVAFARELSELSGPAILESEPFRAIFDGMFDTVRVRFAAPLKVETVIDAIEDQRRDDLKVQYPSDCAYCEISLARNPVAIRVTPGVMELRHPTRRSVKELGDALSIALETLFGKEAGLLLALPEAEA
ncbi:hypothetical protein EP7_000316 [Isosphaeraceae bacterium EP7]